MNYAGVFPVPIPHIRLWWCMCCYLQTLTLQDCLGIWTHKVRVRKEGYDIFVCFLMSVFTAKINTPPLTVYN